MLRENDGARRRAPGTRLDCGVRCHRLLTENQRCQFSPVSLKRAMQSVQFSLSEASHGLSLLSEPCSLCSSVSLTRATVAHSQVSPVSLAVSSLQSVVSEPGKHRYSVGFCL